METIESGLKDLSEIRAIMERASKFLSLSGLSGVSAGLVALGGAAAAYRLFDAYGISPDDPTVPLAIEPGFRMSLIGLGILVLALAILLSLAFSVRMARKQGRTLWGPAAQHLLLMLAIPLVVGAIVTILLLYRGLLWPMPASMLIFYGLGMFSAGSFTLGEVRGLGMLEILLGLLALVLPHLGLLLWAGGFGLLHIVYGLFLYLKYER
jgi:hypothetical protein